MKIILAAMLFLCWQSQSLAIITVIASQQANGKTEYLNLSTSKTLGEISQNRLTYLGLCQESLNIIAKTIENASEAGTLWQLMPDSEINLSTGGLSLVFKSETEPLQYLHLFVKAGEAPSDLPSCSMPLFPVPF